MLQNFVNIISQMWLCFMVFKNKHQCVSFGKANLCLEFLWEFKKRVKWSKLEYKLTTISEHTTEAEIGNVLLANA